MGHLPAVPVVGRNPTGYAGLWHGRFPHNGLLPELRRLLPAEPGLPRGPQEPFSWTRRSHCARTTPSDRHSVREVRGIGGEGPEGPVDDAEDHSGRRQAGLHQRFGAQAFGVRSFAGKASGAHRECFAFASGCAVEDGCEGISGFEGRNGPVGGEDQWEVYYTELVANTVSCNYLCRYCDCDLRIHLGLKIRNSFGRDTFLFTELFTFYTTPQKSSGPNFLGVHNSIVFL